MARPDDETRADLPALARRRGVALSYTDAWGRRRRPSREALAGVLAALGEPPEAAGSETAGVVVAWDGRLPTPDAARAAGGTIELEDGGVVELPRGAHEPLPFGVHRMSGSGSRLPTRVIAAPRRPPAFAAGAWGAFAPTYALRDERGGRSGDLTALQRLGRFLGSLGARHLATLPLLAMPPTEPGAAAPSPYSPVSRMWWDEGFLDLRRLPEVAAEANALPPDVGARDAAAGPVLDLGAARVADDPGPRGKAYRAFLEERPAVRVWARYRARTAGGSHARAAYAQWATDAQLADVAVAIGKAGCSLLLDLPVGCRPDGFDVRTFPRSFARGATIGAPPDRFFVKGQDWGLAPLHPEGDRAAGYPVLRTCLTHVLRHAGALRIDHVMGLQRLWWIPQGAAPDEGAYVAYPSEELLAIACLEASRAGACLVGEDLGTVSPALRRLLAAHGIAGTDVAIFQMEDDPSRPLRVRPGALAMVDTHDTATLAGWLAGDDLALRRRLGLLDGAGDADPEEAARRGAVAALLDRPGAPTAEELLTALLEELGASPAGLVVASLEDLWGERDPQNVPGTTDAHANFSRPLARSLEQVEADPTVRSLLERLDGARRRAR